MKGDKSMKLLDNLNKLTRFLNVGKSMRDSIPIGFLSGLIGTLAMDLSNLMFNKTGVSEKTYAQYAGSVLMSPFRLLFAENRILGQVLHLITGSIIGIPLFSILKTTGKDNYLFKGAVYGTFTWEILYSFGYRYKVFRTKGHSTGSHITSLIDNLVYGFTSAATMIFLTDRKVFSKGSDKQLESELKSDEVSQGSNSPIGDSIFNYENEVRFH